jgi:hypothetical protein
VRAQRTVSDAWVVEVLRPVNRHADALHHSLGTHIEIVVNETTSSSPTVPKAVASAAFAASVA